jgi:hypothetical protein
MPSSISKTSYELFHRFASVPITLPCGQPISQHVMSRFGKYWSIFSTTVIEDEQESRPIPLLFENA